MPDAVYTHTLCIVTVGRVGSFGMVSARSVGIYYINTALELNAEIRNAELL